ncbi:MAG: hypothetical protein EXR00_08170 [Alphaproteobacteria bacterium]|nr:hypothetical protein [Alphaproteobacteria bacterium]
MFKSTMCVAALVVAAFVSSAQGQQAPEDTSEQFFVSCPNRFAVIFPGRARPMMREVNYTTRTGVNERARQFYVERDGHSYMVTVVRFFSGTPVDVREIDHATANLRKLGEVRFQADGAYDPDFPGRQLNIFQPNNRQVRASVYMADYHLILTESHATVGDFAALQFEQSITLIDELGGDFDRNLNDPQRLMPCNRNRA